MDLMPEQEKWWENTDALKENRKIIKKKLRDCLKTNGYKQGRRSSFYQFSEDTAVYYHPEHPSIMTYLWLCFYPLFMPPVDLGIFYFGNRLSVTTNHYIWNIRDYESEESTDEWCRRITEIDETRVASLVQQVSSASSIDRFFNDNRSHLEIKGYVDFDEGILRLGLTRARELWMFAKLALHQYEAALQLAWDILQDEANGKNNVSQFSAEHSRLVTNLAATGNDKAVDEKINAWREANRLRFMK